MARVAANHETSNDGNAVAAASRAVVGTPPPRPPRNEWTANGTPAPRLLLAGLADAYGTTMGVTRNNNFMTHEDQLLVAVEAGRVVGGARVSVRLAGGRRHRPQRWRNRLPPLL